MIPDGTDHWSFELPVSDFPVAPRSLPRVLHKWTALIASRLHNSRSQKTSLLCSLVPESLRYEDLMTCVLHRWMALMSSGLRESRIPLSHDPYFSDSRCPKLRWLSLFRDFAGPLLCASKG
jgi:hypothetical protein